MDTIWPVLIGPVADVNRSVWCNSDVGGVAETSTRKLCPADSMAVFLRSAS